MVHILSFDLEDWFHLIGISQFEDISKWDSYKSILVDSTHKILLMLDKYDTKATFFVLGWIADKYPKLVKQIDSNGHEIASHSYWHRPVYTLTKEEFQNDLKNSIDTLQNLTGKKVYGFRAPSFSIKPGTEWAFDVMDELELNYDSSIFPALRSHGGYYSFKNYITENIFNTKIKEMPISILKIGKLSIPFSGGGYFRACPRMLINEGFKQYEKNSQPVVVYLHPHDFQKTTNNVKIPFLRKVRSKLGVSSTEDKLEMLLQNYSFNTCKHASDNFIK